MNNEVEQKVIVAIGGYLISELDSVERRLNNGDTSMAGFLLSRLTDYLHCSICTYQIDFPDVEFFLTSVRSYIFQVKIKIHSTDVKEKLVIANSNIADLVNKSSILLEAA